MPLTERVFLAKIFWQNFPAPTPRLHTCSLHTPLVGGAIGSSGLEEWA